MSKTNAAMTATSRIPERPIIFTHNVHKIESGEKTQTRRLCLPFPSWQVHSVCKPNVNQGNPWECWFHYPDTERVGHLRPCPYGKPGERLWVRERWRIPGDNIVTGLDSGSTCKGPQDIEFAAKFSGFDLEHRQWRNPMFMPRWASRLLLEITSVRVERVTEISGEDCLAEGVTFPGRERMLSIAPIEKDSDRAHLRNSFRELWNSINAKREGGKYSWERNPFVWVISFRLLDKQ